MGIFGESTTLAIAGFFVTIVSFVLQLIGFSTPLWSGAEYAGITYTAGLWSYCFGGTCKSYSCSEDSFGCTSAFKAAGALECMSFVNLLVAVVLVALKMFKLKDKCNLRYAGAVCCFIGGATALIGTIIYSTDEFVSTGDLNFSFACCILAALCSVASGILILVGKL